MTVLADGWTAVTRNKSLSTQGGHAVEATETGFEVFTLSPQDLFEPPFQGD